MSQKTREKKSKRSDCREQLRTEGVATYSEAATYLSVSERTVRRLMDSGELKKVWVGRSPRISWDSLKKIIGKK